MKKQIGILLAAILILLLRWNLLSAPAVQETDPPEEDIAGSDWRTWGIINDSGTLVQDGETIPFCACVHTGDTTLYHDTESQVLLAELDYPAPVENAEQRYLGMETADRNGDGSSDVLLRREKEPWNCSSAGTRRPGPFDPFRYDRSKNHLLKKEAIL